MRKLIKIFGALFLVMLILLIGGFVFFNTTYPKVKDIPNIKVQITPERVERGKYLANNVTSCIDCHSKRDWSKFAGPVIKGTEGKGGERYGEEMGIPGTVYAKNITPANLKNWTDGEIFRAITEGVTKNGKAMFPLMPYNSFKNMTREDIYSIIAYIRTLDPIENKVPESTLNFPVNYIVKTMPEKYIDKEKPDKNDPVKYGKYLVMIAACSDCHTKRESKDMDYAGGEEFNLPGGTLRSLNITPHKETGIGSWTKDQFIARFKYFDSEDARNISIQPNDFTTMMPWTFYSGMNEEDLGAIYEYLMTLKPVENRIERFTLKKGDMNNN